jgi:hypothetical protein
MTKTMRHRPELLFAAVLLLAGAFAAHADPAPFDLAGPSLEVKVGRGMATLPISEVPNLAPGDQLWIKADGGGILDRIDQSAATKLVFPLRNLGPPVRRGRPDSDRAAGCSTGVGIPGASDER